MIKYFEYTIFGDAMGVLSAIIDFRNKINELFDNHNLLVICHKLKFNPKGEYYNILIQTTDDINEYIVYPMFENLCEIVTRCINDEKIKTT